MPNRKQRRSAAAVSHKLGRPVYELTTSKTNWFIPDFIHRLLVNYTIRRLSNVVIK